MLMGAASQWFVTWFLMPMHIHYIYRWNPKDHILATLGIVKLVYVTDHILVIRSFSEDKYRNPKEQGKRAKQGRRTHPKIVYVYRTNSTCAINVQTESCHLGLLLSPPSWEWSCFFGWNGKLWYYFKYYILLFHNDYSDWPFARCPYYCPQNVRGMGFLWILNWWLFMQT